MVHICARVMGSFGKLAVAHTIHDPVGGRPVDGIGVPLAGSHIGECALAAITLCTVETEQNRDEHRTGHVVRGGEGLSATPLK